MGKHVQVSKAGLACRSLPHSFIGLHAGKYLVSCMELHGLCVEYVQAFLRDAHMECGDAMQ